MITIVCCVLCVVCAFCLQLSRTFSPQICSYSRLITWPIINVTIKHSPIQLLPPTFWWRPQKPVHSDQTLFSPLWTSGPQDCIPRHTLTQPYQHPPPTPHTHTHIHTTNTCSPYLQGHPCQSQCTHAQQTCHTRESSQGQQEVQPSPSQSACPGNNKGVFDASNVGIHSTHLQSILKL